MAFTFTKRGKGRTNRYVPGTMNKTEAAYAETLRAKRNAGLILWCEFESVTLKLAKGTRYTPDFIVMPPDGVVEFHEIKSRRNAKKGENGKADVTEGARIEDDANVKIKVAAAMFPFKFVLIYPDKFGGWVSREVEAA